MEKKERKLLSKQYNNKLKWVLLLCAFGLGLNLLCNKLIGLTSLPLYLDTIGTIVTARLGGALPGVIVALFTNLILGVGNAESVYFGILNILIAVVAAFWFQSREKRYHVGWLALFVLIAASIGGGIGSVQTWVFDGFSTEGMSGAVTKFFYEQLGWTQFWSQFASGYLFDVVDKTITVIIAILTLRFMPEEVRAKLRFTGWKQKPLKGEALLSVKNAKTSSYSLGTKIILVLLVAFVMIAGVVSWIGLVLFRQFSIEQHAGFAQGVAKMASTIIDPDRVEKYLTEGEDAQDYLQVKDLLTQVRDTYPDLQYLYVYQIREDGCHVVFDLDAPDMPGDLPGTVVEFEESFLPYKEQLLAGEDIGTIISNDSYGWLLTEYEPLYDNQGKCVCYVCADVSMSDVKHYEYDFFIKLASLFLGFCAVILATGVWLCTYHLLYPINSMAQTTAEFSYDSDEARKRNVERIRDLDIHTGDELENLYDAFVKATEDSELNFTEMQRKTEVLSLLQSGLIMVLADMVENRDQFTGDHVKKTSAYVRIILEKLKDMGYHAEELTDQYIADVVKSAPLHDVGKIQVSDAILNKPGKLTNEEFEIMKTHTLAGRRIIEQTIQTIPEADYLKEAINLAGYHHEKWNGTGYPYGLSGEEIPLSARVMAVADVFDALVSKRCYKEPYDFDYAMNVIREGSGTHFDPKVAEAFLSAKEEVREVAERFGGEKPAKTN